MRTRITWLVAATTSAIVVAFVIPLCALVANLAYDRGVARARDQAQSVAALVGTITAPEALANAIDTLAGAGPAVAVVDPDGTVVGDAASLATGLSQEVNRARTTLAAFTVRHDHGLDAVVPVATADGVHVVIAGVPDAELTSGVRTAWATIVALGTGLVAAAVLIARELGRRVTVPITELGEVAHRLRDGDLSARAQPRGTQETVEVAGALNRLADRIGSLLRAERETVADLGHRLRTPVTALRIDTELVEDPEVAARLRDHVDHLQRSIDAVVTHARRAVQDDFPTPGDLTAVARERAAFWAPLAEDDGREFATEVPTEPLAVSLADGDLRECLDILIDNVFSHTPEGTGFRLVVGGGAARAWFVVADHGPGLTAGYAGRGDSGSGSTGLGLDIVRRTVMLGGGTVSLDQSAGGGLSVRVELPTA